MRREIAQNRADAAAWIVHGGSASPVVTKIITKISWQQAGRVSEPGRYMFRFGWLTVAAEDLAVWRQYPDAMFTLVELPASDSDNESVGSEFHLGAFELPTPS